MSLAAPLPKGPFLEGLASALDPETVAGLVSANLHGDAPIDGLRPFYIRHKGEDGSVVGWMIRRDDEEIEVPVTVRVAPPERLRSEAERFEGLSCNRLFWKKPAALVEESGLLLIGFPFDRSLRWLRKLVRVTRIRDFLPEQLPAVVQPGWRISKESTFEPVRYKPERRAVLRWNLVLRNRENSGREHFGCYIRLHADRTALRASRAKEAARRAGVSCPETLALVSDGFEVETALPGRPLDVDGTDAIAQVEAAGTQLAALHRVPHGVQHAVGSPVRSVDDELERCRQAAADLGRLDPGWSERAGQIAARLVSGRPQSEESVPLHGDFHPGQVLFEEDRPAFVDFDRSSIGPAAYDLTSFEAHLVVNRHPRARELAEGLEAGYGRSQDGPTRRWFLGSALLRMASTPFRALEPDWPERTDALLSKAAVVVEGRGA